MKEAAAVVAGVICAMLGTAARSQPSLSAVTLLGDKGLCGGLASCWGPPAADGDQRNCECDPKCRDYGDCCEDSPHFSPGRQNASCVSMRQYGLKLVFTLCAADWRDESVRRSCEHVEGEDPLASTPVTHRPTGRTFANAFCAVCNHHGRPDELLFWRKRLECPDVDQQLVDVAHLPDRVFYDSSLHSWNINVSGSSHRCRMDPSKPDLLGEFSRVCPGDMVASCPEGWVDTAVRDLCDSYTSIVYDFPRRLRYRNPHCAVCNGVPKTNLTCSIPAQRDKGPSFDTHSFAILFDFSTSGRSGGVGQVQPCDDGQLFDPFFRICRSVFCSDGHSYSNGNCISGENMPVAKNHTASDDCTSNNKTEECNDSELDIQTCPKFTLSSEEYVVNGNGSIYVPKYDKSFSQAEFMNKSDGNVHICATAIGEQFIGKFAPSMGYITMVGLGVSIVFLTLHLLASACSSELRSLASRNLASLCVALLCSYVFFIKMTYSQELDSMCVVVGCLTYYSFMASFAWTLVIGFDIWRTLRKASSRLMVSSGRQNCKFLVYCACGWGFPGLLLAALVLVDRSPAGVVPDHVRPGLGRASCWFHSRQALLLFFALPFAAIMMLNGFFACSSVLVIRSTAAVNASSTGRRSASLYARLAVITGLTWTVGLAAGLLDLPALWYVFVALNTLQGLFIFLSFTCSTKMARQLRSKTADRMAGSCWHSAAPCTLTSQLDSRVKSEVVK